MLPKTPVHVATTTVGTLTLSGSVILLGVMQEWLHQGLSVLSLVCQMVSFGMACGFCLWRRSIRLLAYPLVLFCTVYVWDTKLPPPTLPDGWLRAGIPFTVMAMLFMDIAYMNLRHTHRFKAQIRGLAFLNGFIPVENAKLLFRARGKDFDAWLMSAQHTVLSGRDRRQYVRLRDVLAALADDNVMDAEREE